MKVTNHTIPSHKLKDFQIILGKCGGYFLRNPEKVSYAEEYNVDYRIDSLEGIVLFQKLWRMVNLDIVEKTKCKTLFQRIKKIFKK